MTDITSNLEKIQVEETDFNSPVSENLLTKIGGSINAIVDDGIEPLGTVIQSILTTTQFQTIKGTKWVLMNGQSISGSDLETLTGISTLPNLVGNKAFSRQSDTDGNITTFEQDAINFQDFTFLTDIVNGPGPGSDTYDFITKGSVSRTATGLPGYTGPNESSSTAYQFFKSNTGRPENETRPTNFYFNFFIKINNN